MMDCSATSRLDLHLFSTNDPALHPVGAAGNPAATVEPGDGCTGATEMEGIEDPGAQLLEAARHGQLDRVRDVSTEQPPPQPRPPMPRRAPPLPPPDTDGRFLMVDVG